MLQKLESNHRRYTEAYGVIYNKGQIVLPAYMAWQMEIIKSSHDSTMVGHPGRCGNSKGPALTKGHQDGTKAGILLQIQNQRPK
ncbi:uncharacterized protein VP01_6156g1 [Puccinia sorghi]|uniref:Uncharacterized protein n=1 Tax=Puccinia sorghi TaxID=27349 RepID=A0A0L6UGT2_9BASI|nr:uncharacterized protein VP01_6156g1 [Puccinia sorghi]